MNTETNVTLKNLNNLKFLVKEFNRCVDKLGINNLSYEIYDNKEKDNLFHFKILKNGKKFKTVTLKKDAVSFVCNKEFYGALNVAIKSVIKEDFESFSNLLYNLAEDTLLNRVEREDSNYRILKSNGYIRHEVQLLKGNNGVSLKVHLKNLYNDHYNTYSFKFNFATGRFQTTSYASCNDLYNSMSYIARNVNKAKEDKKRELETLNNLKEKTGLDLSVTEYQKLLGQINSLNDVYFFNKNGEKFAKINWNGEKIEIPIKIKRNLAIETR